MLVPAYSVAYITNAMIYTMPMLACCIFIAANLFDADEVENRVNEDEISESDSGEMAMMVDVDGGMDG